MTNRDIYSETGGHKTPDDSVVEETYQAESEHGVFIWKVRARREGFNTYADIEDVLEISIPDSDIESDMPSFDIEDDDD